MIHAFTTMELEAEASAAGLEVVTQQVVSEVDETIAYACAVLRVTP